MKDMASSLLAKIMAIFLLVIFSMSAMVCGIGIFFADESKIYEGANSYYNTKICKEITEEYAYKAAEEYYYSATPENGTGNIYFSDTNFSYTIVNSYDRDIVLAQNFEPEEIGYYTELTYDDLIVKAAVKKPITAHDNYYISYSFFDFIYPLRYVIILVFAASSILAVFDLIFLFCAAGHKRGRDGITFNIQDNIPLDLYLLLVGGAFSAVGYFILQSFSYITAVSISMLFLLLLVEGFLALAALMTLATRFKAGKWWKNTVIYFILRFILRFFKRTKIWIFAIFHAVPMVWRTILIGIAFVIIDTMLGQTFVGFIFRILVVVLLTKLTLGLKMLKNAGKKLAFGDIEGKIDTSKLYWDLKEHAENLNSISEGMSIAVEQKMKSERLKTELITNVSHDIKTPLTSIISYVDLLKKEHTPEQEAEYIDVLDRQSKRLKKLTEDVVEASKASTGNITVNLSKTSVAEILRQSVGEYEDRMQDGKLDVVIFLPQEGLYVMADGKLLWRVIDNLMNNVCKYSQPGTRVYIDAKEIKGEVVISFKNISRDKLNVEVEELMERFVRGDSARNSEGSGLGLNIAKSLVELQNGHFNIAVDGDLFKVEMRFKNIT
ncbi:MAG: HAMP domain-containing sensor histidine kinase [Lachnospiraceae bacterium]|nr:HAMP domain-containing sensor histidine kinase [Lachnospiraceae bacterium]